MRIHIPTPCKEDWSGMTPKEKGRFCGSCQKIVVDFTDQSAEDIRDYLIENAGRKTCGRFTAKQLSSPLPDFEFLQTVSDARVAWITKVAAIALFAFSALLSSCSENRTVGDIAMTSDTPRVVAKPLLTDTVLIDTPVAKPICRPDSKVKIVEPMIVGELAPVETELTGDIMVMPDTIKPVLEPQEEMVTGKFIVTPPASPATRNP